MIHEEWRRRSVQLRRSIVSRINVVEEKTRRTKCRSAALATQRLLEHQGGLKDLLALTRVFDQSSASSFSSSSSLKTRDRSFGGSHIPRIKEEEPR
ncbi:hypothetical protein TNCV_1340131 [Trichonephila clavipes]|uniref:Uncharacterized protein n=1 Tax=Trichonephila clavipes TaxID=2585209 RepID=A0A8X6RAZ6_TRICX|nr:hypothetical protein TNCV_1340131 [Trichonephila clavipes]